MAHDWQVIGASVAGTAHTRAGRPGEDAHAWRLRPAGTLVLAVADGAGSAVRAAEGAVCVVTVAVDAADQALDGLAPTTVDGWQALLAQAVRAARAALVARVPPVATTPDTVALPDPALPAAPVLRDFATTLLLAVVSDHWLAAVQIGDGALVISDSAGALTVVTHPNHGEYLNETLFLTGDDPLAGAQFAIRQVADVRAVALLTDGLQALALTLADNTPHAPFFAPFFAHAAQAGGDATQLAAFLNSARVAERTDDDKTLLLAVRP